MERQISKTALLLWQAWGLLSNFAMLGVMLWIDRDKKPTKPHSELPSYDDQLAELFHDERP